MESLEDPATVHASLERALERERTARLICAELNHFTDLKSTLGTVLDWIQHLSGCEATAIRLLDDGDYLYYVHRGFSEGFIRKETHLCARDGSGRRIPDEVAGQYQLDCMCGNVIRGQFDAEYEFFTERGSFWSNGTTALLASTTEEDRQGRTRNRCNAEGYESVALIPIRARDEIVGLIQLNDRRQDRFTEEFIHYCEMLGEQIGLAVHNAMAYERVERTREKLARSNEELERFAAIAAHDLQEPLRMVGSFADLLGRRLEGQLDERTGEYLGHLVDGSRRMQRLVQDLLRYSRVGAADPERRDVDLDVVLAAVLNDLRVHIRETEAVIEADALPTVTGHDTSLGQLLTNLLSNGLKFRSHRPPRIRIRATREGAFWQIRVEDNGIGVDLGHHHKVFDLFHRVHARSRYEGTGLGLAICKKIVQQHGGDIWLESEPGESATFCFTLPAVRLLE
jgi:signal transduction histidine kinase